MRRYRYRTPALTGPWRDTHDDAVSDAVRAKQARRDPDAPSGFEWTVPGEIETRNSEAPATARR